MGEKSSDVRHIEHDQMISQLRELEKEREENTAMITEFIAKQSDFMHNMKEEMIKEIRVLERGIAEKTSMDSGIMTRQAEQDRRLEKMEAQQNETARCLARVSAIVERIEGDQKKDLKAAHDAIRKHEDRIDSLESKGGKVAISAWRWIVAAVLATILSVSGGLIGAKIERDALKQEPTSQIPQDAMGGNR